MQLRGLFFYDGVFRLLNEARSLKKGEGGQRLAWNSTIGGYASLLTCGIRRLVDNGRRADSIDRIIATLRVNAYLLTRQYYVVHDGDPYDWETARDEYLQDVIGHGGHESAAIARGRIGWTGRR